MSPRETPSPPDQGRGRPEQVFFDDPAVDRMMGVILALATEHYVLRSQLQALRSTLEKGGLVDPATLDIPPAASGPEEHQQAARFAESLLRPLLGVQQAAGATGTFSLAKNDGGRHGDE